MRPTKMPAEDKVTAQALKGKTIARVDMHAMRTDGRFGVVMTFPVIRFTDGTCLDFSVEEHPDGDCYGISFIYPATGVR